MQEASNLLNKNKQKNNKLCIITRPPSNAELWIIFLFLVFHRVRHNQGCKNCKGKSLDLRLLKGALNWWDVHYIQRCSLNEEFSKTGGVVVVSLIIMLNDKKRTLISELSKADICATLMVRNWTAPFLDHFHFKNYCESILSGTVAEQKVNFRQRKWKQTVEPKQIYAYQNVKIMKNCLPTFPIVYLLTQKFFTVIASGLVSREKPRKLKTVSVRWSPNFHLFVITIYCFLLNFKICFLPQFFGPLNNCTV